MLISFKQEGITNMPEFILGTAMWGWSIDKCQAFSLLDYFSTNKGTIIDTAINYPINKRPEDMGKPLKWLSEWIKLRKNNDLCIHVKLGATNNLGISDNDLSPLSLQKEVLYLISILGKSLKGLWIHWDNRCFENEIQRTCSFLNSYALKGYSIGLSGIKHPDYYAKALGEGFPINIQIKHNLLTVNQSELYNNYFKNISYWAYGINFGGFHRSPSTKPTDRQSKYNPVEVSRLIDNAGSTLSQILNRPLSDYEIALAFSLLNQHLSAIIIGPKNISQLNQALCLRNELSKVSTNIKNELYLAIRNSTSHPHA